MARAKLFSGVASKPGAGINLNWGNRLTSRMCFAALFNEFSGTQSQNLVNSNRGVLSGTGAPTWIGGATSGLKFNTGGSALFSWISFGIDNSAIDLGRNTNNPATFAFRIYPVAGSGIASRNDSNTVSAGWNIGFNSTIGYVEYIHEASSVNMSRSWLCPVGRWSTVVIATDGSLTAANTLCWINGKLATVNASANGSGTPGTDSTRTLYIGRSEFAIAGVASTSFNGYMDFFHMWKRMLGPNEIQEFTANPYSVISDPGDLLRAIVKTIVEESPPSSPMTSPVVPFFIAP